MIKFINYLGGKDFIEQRYPIQNRAQIPYLREFLNEKPSSTDVMITEKSFQTVYEKNQQWVENLRQRILAKDLSEMFGALGEMRAYASLLDMGFDVTPNGTKAGPDFTVTRNKTINSSIVNIEVATKTLPQQNICQHHKNVQKNQETVFFEIAYFGFPNEGENDTENAVSKIASTKDDAHQASENIPTILYIDFQSLAMNSSMIKMAQPCFSSLGTFFTGCLWAAFYGEKGLPLIEELRMGDPRGKNVEMRHSGKFSKKNTCKFAGALCSFSSCRNGLCFFENPNRTDIPDWFKVHMVCHHAFSLQNSCLTYHDFNIKEYIAMRNKQLISMGKLYQDKEKY